MIKRMYHWCKDRAMQRTSWDGLILIGVCLVALSSSISRYVRRSSRNTVGNIYNNQKSSI